MSEEKVLSADEFGADVISRLNAAGLVLDRLCVDILHRKNCGVDTMAERAFLDFLYAAITPLNDAMAESFYRVTNEHGDALLRIKHEKGECCG